jgi:hypothetical protein
MPGMAIPESTEDAPGGGGHNQVWRHSLAGCGAGRAQPFVIVLLLLLTTRLLWAAIIPIWQTPDEGAHTLISKASASTRG